MSLRGFWLIFQVFAFAVLFTASANAATVTPTESADGGSTVSLVHGGTYTYSTSVTTGAIGTAGDPGLFFNFNVPSAPVGTLTLSAQGELLSKIANLTLTWLDSSGLTELATLQVTDGTGANTGNNALALALISTGDYFLRVTGTVLNAESTFQIAVTATPIPPALLLFGSALAGLGFLGRRSRRNKVAAALS
jgi:hypothetical protein